MANLTIKPASLLAEIPQTPAGLSSSEITRMGRSFKHEPEKHVSGKQLAAVERELYETDAPERAFLTGFLDLVVGTVIQPRHVEAYVAAATKRQTGFARADWSRCTLADLRAIAQNVKMDPVYSYGEVRWFHADWRARASLFYLQQAMALV